MEVPPKSDHSGTIGHVDHVAREVHLDRIGVDSNQLHEKAAQYGMDQVDVDGLAHESLTIKSKATLRLALVTLIWGMSVLAFAIDLSVMGSMAAMPAFRDYYGTETTGAKWGIIVAIYSIGNLAASYFLWMGDLIGRRGIAFVGSVILTIGCVLQGTAPNTGALMGGRFVAGMGAALCATIGQTYMTEVAPACYRGLAVGLYCSCYQIGSIMISALIFGSSYIDGIWSFRLPLVFQIGPAALVAILIYPCTPESPRWLVSKGKIEKARQVIAKYQTTSEDVNSRVVSVQIEQIQASLETLTVKAWDYSVFWKSPSGRYRIWIIILYSFFQQWNGGGLLYSYLPGILEMVGIETAQKQLAINLGMTVVSWISTLIGASFVDRINRRLILLTTTSLFIFFLSFMALVNGLYANKVAQHSMGILAIISLYLFNVATGLFLNVLHNVYPSESLHLTQRAKGMGAYSFFQAAFGFGMTYGSAAALKSLEWKVYFLYVAINIICMALIWQFCPEFQLLSLEEIDLVFETRGVASKLSFPAGPVKLSVELQKAKKISRKDMGMEKEV